jgi:hypothetical protein
MYHTFHLHISKMIAGRETSSESEIDNGSYKLWSKQMNGVSGNNIVSQSRQESFPVIALCHMICCVIM